MVFLFTTATRPLLTLHTRIWIIYGDSFTSSRVRYKFIDRRMLTVPHISKSHTESEYTMCTQIQMQGIQFSFHFYFYSKFNSRLSFFEFINIFIGHIVCVEERWSHWTVDTVFSLSCCVSSLSHPINIFIYIHILPCIPDLKEWLLRMCYLLAYRVCLCMCCESALL